MSRKLRQLLLVLGLVLIVGIVVLVLVLTPVFKNMGENTVSSKAESTGSIFMESHDSKTLLSREETEVVSFTIENANDTYEFYPTKTDDGISWQITGYEGLPMYTGNIVTIAQMTYDLESFKTVGLVADLDEYGLKNPLAVLTAQYTDGSEFVMKVGNVTATSQTRRYATVTGDENVYVISCDIVANFCPENIFDTVIYDLDVQDEAEEWVAPSFDFVQITGRDHPDDIMITPSKQDDPTHPAFFYAYQFTKPFAAAVNNGLEDNELLALSTMTAERVVVPNPTEEDLEAYGFNDPINVAFSVDATIYRFSVGNVEGNIAYLMTEDTPFIYAVDTDAAAIALETFSELRDPLVMLLNLDTISAFKLAVEGGKTYEIEVDHKADASSDTSSTSSQSYTNYAYYNGEVLSYFNDYLQVFLEAYREEDITEETVRGNKLFTVTVEFHDEHEKEAFVAEIYECQGNSRRVIYVLNGRDDCTVKSSWADKVINDIEKTLNGKKLS